MDFLNQRAVLFVQLRIQAQHHGTAIRGDPSITLFRIAGIQQHLALGGIKARGVDGVVNRIVAVDWSAIRLPPHRRIVIDDRYRARHSANPGQTGPCSLPALHV